ncbi:hypothetical protein ANCDUO_04308 [Ancylostoma duodenale]|uniref:Uncharacterized protein n=1 Tax=Ancylostoma duodenale TaxID=51022 RepID=A0A0C2H7I5_9BILA|nr:hypothetical protein ANCDUO_04308 [Ancylostoma duodenale]
MLRIVEFPTVALFRRDHQQALYMQRFSNHTYIDIDNVIMNDARNSHAFTLPPIALTSTMRPTTTQVPLVDCSRFPDR